MFNRIEPSVVLSILEKHEQTIADEAIENAIVITDSGKVVRCFGDLNGVYPDEDLGNELMGAFVTHNHPLGSDNEYSFSDNDIQLFRDYNLSILRGIDDKYIYELSRLTSKVDDAHTLEELMMSSGDLVRHDIVIDIAKENGWGYRRWPRK